MLELDGPEPAEEHFLEQLRGDKGQDLRCDAMRSKKVGHGWGGGEECDSASERVHDQLVRGLRRLRRRRSAIGGDGGGESSEKKEEGRDPEGGRVGRPYGDLVVNELQKKKGNCEAENKRMWEAAAGG